MITSLEDGGYPVPGDEEVEQGVKFSVESVQKGSREGNQGVKTQPLYNPWHFGGEHPLPACRSLQVAHKGEKS